jgi:hypothetical protein
MLNKIILSVVDWLGSPSEVAPWGNETVSGAFSLLASKGVTLDATSSPSASERSVAIGSPPRRYPECDKRFPPPPTSRSWWLCVSTCFGAWSQPPEGGTPNRGIGWWAQPTLRARHVLSSGGCRLVSWAGRERGNGTVSGTFPGGNRAEDWQSVGGSRQRGRSR